MLKQSPSYCWKCCPDNTIRHFDDDAGQRVKKPHFRPVVSFLLLATPFFALLTTTLLFGSSMPTWLVATTTFPPKNDGSFFEGDDDQFISAITNDADFCNRFYKGSGSEFVCWWLHLEKDPASRSISKSKVEVLAEQGRKNDLPTTRRQHFLTVLRQQALSYYFRPRLSPTHRQLMLNLTRMCLSVIESLDLPYFLFAGSLLGYIRHNKTIIPWDDDVDVALIVHRPDEIPMMASIIHQQTLKMYSGAIAMYPMFHMKMKRLKCFAATAPSVDGYEWHWPFIDFQFMRYRRSGLFHIDTFIQDMDIFYEKYPSEYVFPLKRVYYSEENIPLFVPNNPDKAIGTDFKNIEKCQSPTYNHQLERPYDRFITVDCSELPPLISNYYL